MSRRHSDVHEPPESRENTDREVLARMATGDASALSELYDRHARTVYSFTYRIVAQDAGDVTQEVFSQAWRHAQRYDRSRAPVGAWLMMITRARAIDSLRARRAHTSAEQRAVDVSIADLPYASPSQESAVISAEEAARVRHALAGLSQVQRAVIELAFYGGFTHAEIAEQLREPLGTIKTKVRLGLMKLRTALVTQGRLMCSLSLGERGHRTRPLATWRFAADRCHDWYGALYGDMDMLFTRQQSPDAHRAGAYGTDVDGVNHSLEAGRRAHKRVETARPTS